MRPPTLLVPSMFVPKALFELNASRVGAQLCLMKALSHGLPFRARESPGFLLQGVFRKLTMIDRCSRPEMAEQLRDLANRRTFQAWRYREWFLAPRLAGA